jgi:hypothetical protein
MINFPQPPNRKNAAQALGDKLLLIFKETRALHNSDPDPMIARALQAKVARLKRDLAQAGVGYAIDTVAQVAEQGGTWEQARAQLGPNY